MTTCTHSRIVRDFAHSTSRSELVRSTHASDWAEQTHITLRSPVALEQLGFEVRVTFSTFVPIRDDAKGIDTSRWIRIRSANWRAEDEPFGVFPIAMARNFYRNLLAAGFEVEQSF